MNETLRTIRALRKLGAYHVVVGDVSATFPDNYQHPTVAEIPAGILPGAYGETAAEAKVDLASLLGAAGEWDRMTDEEREAVQYHSAGG